MVQTLRIQRLRILDTAKRCSPPEVSQGLSFLHDVSAGPPCMSGKEEGKSYLLSTLQANPAFLSRDQQEEAFLRRQSRTMLHSGFDPES